ncbi:4-(cytidine 5'-diphospho)-2-C-methyl-D-erythritol kinase [Rickettsiales endosymbiont of Stachyamoeba lipophora]|uniref:4-(cytidine 5'-diphospho)-2-C-methyl-D-erythritol kinase n=1 Tax=Rickettsiales endosymbiont of Stachyamoeba lipophora TaxID=2486578 RepID=UPI000F647530|nr:4-(cytidine 5'-diphospho)-2-C-methyl-D-erythritol kinase [Rickettsiales endosymbiont of Stachyamoeba lipophora]AZL15035.1 4-(cytidine 5'-diphospho)-2-C-methyl-D-erythritol kinase [Rickettsiales endosymbiont of Stachyamoeba lipophora]
MKQTIIQSPAKINLTLSVLGKKNNFHLLNSLAVFGVIEDQLLIQESNDWQINVVGNYAHLITGENILYKLFQLALNKQKNLPPLKIVIEKNIPVGGGLGGGSANAAAVARYLNDNYQLEFSSDELATIGADVPICYQNKPVIFSGIGEKIEHFITLPKLYIQIVNPNKTLLTKDVFDKINPEDFYQGEIKYQTHYNNLESLVADLQKYGNNLIKAANNCLPAVGELINWLNLQPGCMYASMSGTGASCFAIFNNKENLVGSNLKFIKSFPYYLNKIGEI